MIHPFRHAAATALLLVSLHSSAAAWSPGSSMPAAVGSPTSPLQVDSNDRNDVVSFYQYVYKASNNFAGRVNWTGNVSACNPGSTGADFKDDIRRRVNWYRAMSDIPADIVFNTTLDQNAQAAALIMAEMGDLSHYPGEDFGQTGCWTAAGENGANNGNLALGSFGVDSIDSYLEDSGIGNHPVGHRRWILHPRITRMGTGDIPSSGAYPYSDPGEHWAANCLYVSDGASFRSGTGSFVSWPPSGFVPSVSVWPRWSLQFNSTSGNTATFGSATVTMTRMSNNANIPTTVVYRYTGGGLSGDPAIVWEPNWAAFGGAPPLEEPIRVTVSGITAGLSGAPSSRTYYVTLDEWHPSIRHTRRCLR